ncbi:MAG TPA: porin [Kofleriaceae bacterium]|nr:porin [Kofleriaceae bacterium]
MTPRFAAAFAAPLVTLLGTAPALAQDAPPVPNPVPAPVPDAAPAAGYDKGFFIRGADELFALKLQGRVQVRYSYEAIDGGEDDSAFEIARARLTAAGHAYSKDIEYKLQVDFGKGNVTLQDFLVDYRLGGGDIYLRAGQWKRPFSRQQITSSGSLELVDRAITDKAFGGSRDIGLALHNDYETAPAGLEWVLGVFNGTGDKPSFSGDVVVDPLTGEGSVVGGGFSNVPAMFAPMIVTRVGWNNSAKEGYKEADFKGGPLRFGVGASALVELDADEDDESSVRGEIDYFAKVSGFSTTGGVYVATAQDDVDFADQSYAALGFHLQGGYLIDGTYQPAVRVAMVDPDGDDNNTLELAGGLSVYQFEHGFKWQTDVSLLAHEGSSTNDILVRTQLQLSF